MQTRQCTQHGRSNFTKMKSIHVDLLSTQSVYNIRAGGEGGGLGGVGGGGGGGSKFHEYFFKPTFFIYFGLFLFCTRTFTFFFIIMVPSLSKSVLKIQVTNPPPWIID